MYARAIGAPAERHTYLVTVAIAAVWIVAALARTEVTFHLGPVILPMIPLLVATKGSRAKAVGVAVGIGAGVITVLSLTGNLSGPSFDPFSSAFAESVFTLVGAGSLAFGLARFTR